MILAAEVSAGTLGFLVVVSLFVFTWFLIRGMGKRLKRLPDSFDEVSPEDPDGSASGPTAGA